MRDQGWKVRLLSSWLQNPEKDWGGVGGGMDGRLWWCLFPWPLEYIPEGCRPLSGCDFLSKARVPTFFQNDSCDKGRSTLVCRGNQMPLSACMLCAEGLCSV